MVKFGLKFRKAGPSGNRIFDLTVPAEANILIFWPRNGQIWSKIWPGLRIPGLGPSPNLIAFRIVDEPTAEQRMIAVVRWYLSAFHAGRKSSVAKKPYNPILGEEFHCYWTIANGGTTNNNAGSANASSFASTGDGGGLDSPVAGSGSEPTLLTFVAEQVSHHPPSKICSRISFASAK